MDIERYWDSKKVRIACINAGLYALGNDEEYAHILNKVDERKRNPDNSVIYEVAQDILDTDKQIHDSDDFDMDITTVLYVLLNHAFSYFPVMQ